jgi:hypothetical protein
MIARMKIALAVALATITSTARADTVIMIAEEDIGCLDKAAVAKALKEPLEWVRTSDGRYYVPYADQFDMYNYFANEAHKEVQDRVCNYLGNLLGAKFVDRAGVPAFVAPVPARVNDRDSDLVCLQHPDAPPTAKCYWASARPPSQRVRGPRPR